MSPARFPMPEKMYEHCVDHAKDVRADDRLAQGTTIGPLTNTRRVAAIEGFIADSVQHGATVRTGGHRIGDKVNFFEPTVLTDIRPEARAMNEEPFGPLAVIAPFGGFDDALAEANRPPYGLASDAYTQPAKAANASAAAVEAGMMAINHHGLA
jgi:succinate-semialdehyde dehydrogenase / glutarate-semialdehyde dehydrogenase